MKTFLTAILVLEVGASLVLLSVRTRTSTNDAATRMAERVEAAGSSLQTVSEVEMLWPNEPRVYFQAAERFAKIAEGPAHTNANTKKEVLDLFDSVLQKQCPADDRQAIECFEHKYKTIMHCLNVGEVRADKSRLLAIARFLGEVRARRIPNYRARGTRFPGQEILMQAGVMEASSLTNPILKEAYHQAIEDNAQDQVMNDLQRSLKAVDGSTTHFLLGTLRSIPRQDVEFIGRIVDAAHLSEEERTKL